MASSSLKWVRGFSGKYSVELVENILPVQARLNASQLKSFKDWQFSFEGEKNRQDKKESAELCLYGSSDTVDKIRSKKRIGFTFNKFRSGEMTGARFSTGLESQMNLTRRPGCLVTESLTKAGKTKIRRAIQNSNTGFKCFMTVTFSPSHCQLWETDENGTVRQDFAKYKFKKFINSIKVACDRKALASGRLSDKIAYVWVAEIQEKTTKNVHFHVLLNHRLPIKWLTKLWAQAENSIDVAAIRSLNHASCYLRKYITKDEKNPIQGNRYGISQELRETMKPEKKSSEGRQMNNEIMNIIHEMTDTIESNGGSVLDHGFYIPAATRSEWFKDWKTGKKRKTMSVNKGLCPFILSSVDELQTTNVF